MDTLSRKLRIARAQAGMTQQQLAEQLELTRGAIGQWEAGRTTPTLENLHAVARATGVDIEWLAGSDYSLLVNRISNKVPEMNGEVITVADPGSAVNRMAARFWDAVTFEVTKDEPEREAYFERRVPFGSTSISPAYLTAKSIVEFMAPRRQSAHADFLARVGQMLMVEKAIGKRGMKKVLIIWTELAEAVPDDLSSDMAERFDVQIHAVSSPAEAAEVILALD